jgi:hypothetical protein
MFMRSSGSISPVLPSCLAVWILAGCGMQLPAGSPAFTILGARAGVQVGAQVELQPVPIFEAQVPEFFGVPLEGAQDIVFVLDRSGSMSLPAEGAIARSSAPVDDTGLALVMSAATKMEVARNELADAVARLPDGTRINIVLFESSIEAFAPGLIPLEGTVRENLQLFMREIEADGSTALSPAMRAAFLMDPQRIILLSDGRGNVGPGAELLLRDARGAISGGLRIDTVGLGGDQDRQLLGTLARESGGIYQAL